MDNAVYALLSRQSGLMEELRVLADNIANASTSGFRREEVIFAEHVARINPAEPSLSIGTASGRRIDPDQGPLKVTGSAFDLAIEGPGFFEVDTPEGRRLTRAGAFSASAEGVLVTPAGHPVLDVGGAPILIPPEAQDISVGSDGTVSAGGQPLGQLSRVLPADWTDLQRRGGSLFESPSGTIPAEDGKILQGFIEESNVTAFLEYSRLIEIQNAYVQGQKFLEQENERVRSVIQVLSK